MIASRLDSILRSAGIPIDGVAIPTGAENNKALWRVDFSPGATQAQMDAAQVIVDAFVVDTPEMQFIRLHYASRVGFLKALKALDAGVHNHTIGVNTLADLRSALAAAAAIIDGLNPVFAADFARLRDMLSLTGNLSTMTLANCQALFKEARNWLNSRVGFANAAEDALE